MRRIAEAGTEYVSRHMSRRGFLAGCGKVALSLGLAMLGVAKEPYLARAHSLCCTFGAGECTNVAEVDCPVDPGCPVGCALLGYTTCCHINKEIACWECGCVVDCHCAYPTGNPC